MTWRKREIMEMAREAGFEGFDPWIVWDEQLEAFAKLVREDEREACAKFFDDNDTNLFWGSQAASHIRARGQA